MQKALYIFIILIGFLQITGYLSGIKIIKNLGVITSASPLPIVFTEVKGVETFASDFYIQWSDNNKVEKVKITPSIYSKLKGPYNRRNIFGAAIAYGPILPKSIWQPILNYGICNDILQKELEIPFNKENCTIEIETRTKSRNDHWTLKTECKN